MPVTLSDIANEVKVSTATVSRILNGIDDPLISEATRKRVTEVAKAMGYKPNAVARALVSGRTNIVALWTIGIYPVYCSNAIRCCKKPTSLANYDLRVVDLNMLENPFGLVEWPSDGVLAFDIGYYLNSSTEVGPPPGIPTVSFGVDFIETIDYVGVDLQKASREAVEHLAGSGRKRIACFLPSGLKYAQDARRRAYLNAMEDVGLKAEIIPLNSNHPTSFRIDARKMIRDYFTETDRPDALLCFDDEIAIGAYRGLLDLGMRVPDDVAIIGCGGIEETEYHNPPISTISIPLENICCKAWEFLYNRMQNPNVPQQEAMVEASLIVRGSS